MSLILFHTYKLQNSLWNIYQNSSRYIYIKIVSTSEWKYEWIKWNESMRCYMGCMNESMGCYMGCMNESMGCYMTRTLPLFRFFRQCTVLVKWLYYKYKMETHG